MIMVFVGGGGGRRRRRLSWGGVITRASGCILGGELDRGDCRGLLCNASYSDGDGGYRGGGLGRMPS